MTAALYGYEIVSELPLSCARSTPTGRGAVCIEVADRDLLACWGELAVWAEEPQGFAVFDVDGDLLVWCEVCGSFRLEVGVGRVITTPTGSPDAWEHRLSATVLPLLLAQRGDLALHAATVLDRSRAVAFCGTTGRGKSTLSAAVGLRGRTVLAEDGTIISGLDQMPVIWPGPLGVRVTAEAWMKLGGRPGASPQSGKAIRPVQSDRSPICEPQPLAGVVVLAPRGGRALELRRLSPTSALRALVPNAIFAGPDALAATLRQVARLVDQVPVFEARLPDDLGQVVAAAEEILAQVSVAA